MKREMIRIGLPGLSSPVRKLAGAVFLLAFFALLLVPHFIPNKAVAIPVESQINGFYTVYVQHGDTWEKAGKIGFDRFFNEKRLDLSSFLKPDEPARVRIVQTGGGAAHIDSVFLGGFPPVEVKTAAGAFVLEKLSRSDFDVIDAFGKSIELVFPPEATEGKLSLSARVEAKEISKIPFLFPLDNLYSEIGGSSSFYRYRIKEAEKFRTAPFFKEFSLTGSGHPSGWTYGWVSNDGENLYVRIDFTPDNTMDGNKDYSKVFIKTADGIREFKISENETEWGVPHFTYTDKVAYQHKLYDFKIPLSELGAMGEGEILLAFAAYGTASALYVSPDGNNTNGFAWATAYNLIDTALTQANADPFLSAVCVATGAYTAPAIGFQPAAGVSLIGAKASTATKSTYCFDTSGTGFGAGASVISGAGNSGTIKYNNPLIGLSTFIEGFSVTNSSTIGEAIHIRRSSPTISGNTIAGNAHFGIYVYAASGDTASPLITGNDINSNSSHGIYVFANARDFGTASAMPTISNNTISSNAFNGIFVNAYAYKYSASATVSPIITGNTIQNNSFNGILGVARAERNSAIATISPTITANTITNNKKGIDLEADANSDNAQAIVSGTINNNTSISGNSSDGIYISAIARAISAVATASPTISNNTAVDNNLGVGIHVLASALLNSAAANASPTISGNSVTSSGSDGIYIYAYVKDNDAVAIASPTISDNMVSANVGYGMHIYAKNFSGTFTALATASPTIANNTVSLNGQDGLYINAYASLSEARAFASPVINNNTITSNGWSGIRMSATNNSGSSAVVSPTIKFNTVTGNTQNGVLVSQYAAFGTTVNPDLGTAGLNTGGNTIKNNADLAGDGTPYTNAGFFDLLNDGSSSVLAQNNWWAVTPPIEGTDNTLAQINLGTNGFGGTVDASLPLAQSLAFTVNPPIGAAGITVTITAGADTLFVDKAGASVDNANISVTIGGAPATNIVVAAGGGSMTATVPAGSVGSQDVIVTNPAGQTGTLVGGFSYGIDTLAPRSPSIVINGGAQATSSVNASVGIAANDNIGVTGYFVSESATTPTAGQFITVISTTSFSAAVSLTLSSGDGVKTVNAWFMDAAGNISSMASATITLDTINPTAPGTPTDAGTVSGASVTFNWAAGTDSGSGLSHYLLSVGTTPGSANILNASNVGNVLTATAPGSNGQTLYAFVVAVDKAGNSSGPSGNSDGILVDTIAPSAPSITSTFSFTNDSTPFISGTCAEVGTTVTITSNVSGSMGSTTCNSNWFKSSQAILSDGSHTVTATATDAAGNPSLPSAGFTFTVDTIAPVGTSIVINSADPTSVFDISVDISGTDNNGITDYSITESAFASTFTTVGPTTSFSATVPFTLSGANNPATVNLFFKDVAGNISIAASATISLDTATPPPSLVVNSTDDFIDANPGDNVCADGSGNCTLRAAIMEANARVTADTITLPAGTYTLSRTGRDEDGATQGDLDITDDLTINGAGQATTIIDGGGIDRIFDVSPYSVSGWPPPIISVAFSDLTIKNGDLGGNFTNGGGIRLDSPTSYPDTVTITNCTLSGNNAYRGGALWVRAGGVTITDSRFLNNSAQWKGGAIYDEDEGIYNITGTTFDGNSAWNDGGAIYMESDDNSELHLTDSALSNNTADVDGGAIHLENDHDSIHVTIDNSIITGNSAGDEGGGIYIWDDNRDIFMTVTQSTISNNSADNDGGGIYNDDGDNINFIESTISGNSAGGDGGGVYISENLMDFVNVTISGNSAAGDGGGIYVARDTEFFNITVTDNTADSDNDGFGSGGGFFIGGTPIVDIRNSVVAGNFTKTTHDGPDPDCAGDLTSGGFNLVGDLGTTCTGVTDGVNGDIVDPQPNLGTLADNGGPTLTHVLFTGSPAVDAGDPLGCFDHLGNLLAIDQRGFTRPVNSLCDIGAYEGSVSTLTAPALVYPEDGDEDIGSDTTLIWKKAVSADGSSVSYQLLYCTDSGFEGCEPVDVPSSMAKMFYGPGGTAGLAGLLLFGFAFTLRRDGRLKGLFVFLLLSATTMTAVSCGGLSQNAPSSDKSLARVQIVLPSGLSLQANGILKSSNPRLQGVEITSITITVTGEDMETITESVPLNKLEVELDVPSGDARTFAVSITGSKGEIFTGSETIDLEGGEERELVITVSLIPNPAVDEIAFPVSGLESDTTYFWKVIATDQSGNSITSAVFQFTTAK